ncbi:hypothetical protein ABE10_03330, partial [Bacillus toyonensis]|nr:hypothetical protein [Bacillus toyonensis]
MTAHAVRDAQQQGHDEPVGHERGSARGEERRREAGEGDHARDPADHDEHLERDRDREPGREKLAEVVLSCQSDAQAAAHEHHVEAEDREEADETQLLAEAGDDVVALGQRGQLRAPLAEAGADEPAVREAEDALDQLVAAAGGVDELLREGVQPAEESSLHVAEDLGRDPDPDHDHHQADEHPARLAGGDVQHHDEHAEDQHPRTEIALRDDDAEGDHPDHHHGPELAHARPGDAQEPLADGREALAGAHEVAGEEDREADLGELAGLEGEDAADGDPDVGVRPRRLETGDERQQEQQDPGQAGEVGEPVQHTVVAQQHDQRDRPGQRDGGPGELLGGERGPAAVLSRDVDPVDHRDPEPGEQRRDREDERIGGRGDEPQDDVQREREDGKAPA